MDFFSEMLLTKRFKPFSTAVAGTYRIALPFKMRVLIIASAGGGGWGHQPSTTNSHSGAGMGGSGAGFRGELVLPRGTLTVVVGAAGVCGFWASGQAGGDTSITFADGTQILLGGGKGGSCWKGGGSGGAGGTASTTRSDCPAGSLINGTASATGRSYCAGVTLFGQPSVLSDGSQTDENVGFGGASGKIYMDERSTYARVPVAAGSFIIQRI